MARAFSRLCRRKDRSTNSSGRGSLLRTTREQDRKEAEINSCKKESYSILRLLVVKRDSVVETFRGSHKKKLTTPEHRQG